MRVETSSQPRPEQTHRMLKKWLSLLLLVLIACQSVWVMADSHPIESSGAGHSQNGHMHTLFDRVDTDMDTSVFSDSNLELDGHHCHGSAHLFVFSFAEDFLWLAEADELPGYSSTHNSLKLSPSLRPPIG